MKPYYEQDGITIYHGDCRDVLPLLSGESYALVTDPPFGIDFDYGGYDDARDSYPELMRDLVRLTDPLVGNGPRFVWQGMPNADKWHQWFPPGFRLFAACKGFVQYRPVAIQYSWDPIIFWGELEGEPNAAVKDYHVQRLAPFGAGRERIDHPCPRPLEQVRHVIASGTTKTRTVLDPFMGSGTTLRAAKDLGRKAIGIEIEERYCEVAAKRMAQAVLL